MVYKFLQFASGSLLALTFLTGCETLGGVADKVDRVVSREQPKQGLRIEQAWADAAKRCAIPPPGDMTLANPVCVNLVVRGREMECVAPLIRQAGLINRYGAPDGLLNWEICVKEIARVLADGYYFSTREIERRLQLCDVILEAAPSQPPSGSFSRFLAKGKELEAARPAPAEYGVAGRQAPVGVLKCEVLLPPAALPVEVKPVSSEPVVESLPQAPQPEATTAAKPAAPKAKPRVTKGVTKPSSGAKPGAINAPAPAGVGGDSVAPGDALDGVKVRGKQT